mgnify:CR=1 FL=1
MTDIIDSCNVNNTENIRDINILADHISRSSYKINKDKYKKYFLGLYNSLNDEKPSYHEFISMVEVMDGNSAPATFYPKVFSGFTIQGLKKDTLITTAKITLDAIKQDAVNFNNKMQDKINNEIGAKKKTIEQKMKEIEDLQKKIANLGDEINQIRTDVVTSEEKIKNGIAVYNVFSKEIVTKIERDIQNIETFINN